MCRNTNRDGRGTCRERQQYPCRPVVWGWVGGCAAAKPDYCGFFQGESSKQQQRLKMSTKQELRQKRMGISLSSLSRRGGSQTAAWLHPRSLRVAGGSATCFCRRPASWSSERFLIMPPPPDTSCCCRASRQPLAVYKLCQIGLRRNAAQG